MGTHRSWVPQAWRWVAWTWPQCEGLGTSVSLRTAFLVMALCVFSPQRALPSACSWGTCALLCSAGWDSSALGRLLPACGRTLGLRPGRSPEQGAWKQWGRRVCPHSLREGVLVSSSEGCRRADWSLARALRHCPATEWGGDPSSPCEGPGVPCPLYLGWANVGCEDLSGFWILVTYPSPRTQPSVPDQGLWASWAAPAPLRPHAPTPPGA